MPARKFCRRSRNAKPMAIPPIPRTLNEICGVERWSHNRCCHEQPQGKDYRLCQPSQDQTEISREPMPPGEAIDPPSRESKQQKNGKYHDSQDQLRQ